MMKFPKSLSFEDTKHRLINFFCQKYRIRFRLGPRGISISRLIGKSDFWTIGPYLLSLSRYAEMVDGDLERWFSDVGAKVQEQIQIAEKVESFHENDENDDVDS
jgi:hypothetical protein